MTTCTDSSIRPIATHEHAWVTESQHATSEGVVRYARCVACDSRRVELQYGGVVPDAISRVV